MQTPSKPAVEVFRRLVKPYKTLLAIRRPSESAERPRTSTSPATVAACLLLWLLLAACTAPTTESGGPTVTSAGLSAVVDRVVDGDTIIVAIGDHTETVRLLGIDTPEKAGGPRPAECFGSEASAYAQELLPAGTAVLLSRDQETRDQYSRLLAFVHRADDGLFVNLAMLEGGYAVPLFFSPNTSLEEPFTSAANAARRNWVGLWPTCGAADVALSSS